MPLSLDPDTISLGGQTRGAKYNRGDIFFKSGHLNLSMQLRRKIGEHQFTNSNQRLIRLLLLSARLCDNTPTKIESQPGGLIQQSDDPVTASDDPLPILQGCAIISLR